MEPTNLTTADSAPERADSRAQHAPDAAVVSIEEQFRLLMQEVVDYAIFFTDASARIITWNAGAERILGWKAAEILGQPAETIFTPEDCASNQPQQEIGAAAATGRAEDERWHLRKDGSRFWASGVVTALRDDTGQLRGFCKILRDLTERKKWEQDLQHGRDRDLHVAHTLQTSFLMVPPPDAFPGLVVKALYESASDDTLIGGDFFDVFAVTEDRIALVVGDATGKGLEAATYTAEVKFALRAFLREYPHPAIALHRLNTFVVDKERLDPRHLVTSYVALALCVIDAGSHELVSATAGSEPPFVLRAETGEALPLERGGGPLLGVGAESEYEEQRLTLSVGDVLAMSTDGLTEARRGMGRSREFFGYDGVVRAVREELERHPNSLADAGLGVAKQARQFAGDTINDDICLLLARCLPRDAAPWQK